VTRNMISSDLSHRGSKGKQVRYVTNYLILSKTTLLYRTSLVVFVDNSKRNL